MNRRLDLTSGEAGQVTIEMILLLIITVILILGLLYQFNQSFKSYAEAFFDGYVACLLETGDLPGSGGVCRDEFQAYDPNAGQRLVNGEVPEGQGGNWNGQGGGNWEGQGGGNWNGQGGGNWEGQGGGNWGDGGGSTGGGGTSGSGGGDGGGGGSTGGSEAVAGNAGPGEGTRSGALGVGRFNSRSRSSVTNVGSASAAGANGDKGSDDLLGKSPTSAVGELQTGYSRRGSLNMGFEYYGDEEERGRETERPPVAPITQKSTNDENLRPKTSTVTLNRAPAQKSGPDTGGMSFGQLIKFLFIAALIIAIVIFFGGQAMQISKSREK